MKYKVVYEYPDTAAEHGVQVKEGTVTTKHKITNVKLFNELERMIAKTKKLNEVTIISLDEIKDTKVKRKG